MLNYIWAFMIMIGVVYGAVAGRMAEVTNAALDSAGEAISLCITMAGVVALWMGLMEIAGKAGLVEKLYDVLSGKAENATSLEASVESHLMAICAERSRLEGGRLIYVHGE